jgi:hypothetical protein
LNKAFVYTTDLYYSDEAKVLTYSLQKYHPEIPIFLILCYRDYTDRRYEEIYDKFVCFSNISIHELPDGMSWNKQIKFRYKFACDLSTQGFDSVCILDADMLCLHNMDLFFNIANSGTIVACADNMITKWNKEEIKKYFNEDVTEFTCDIQERVSNVPWFYNPQVSRITDMLYEMDNWDNHEQCDYTLLNYFMFKHKIMDITLVVNSYQFTNIHHTMLKPDTFVKDLYDRHGRHFYSEQGQRVYMIHGHWNNQAYLSELMEPMKRNYSWHPKSIETAQNVVNILERVYKEFYDQAIIL